MDNLYSNSISASASRSSGIFINNNDINPNPETALIPDIHIGIRHHQVYSVSVVRRQTTDATNDLYANKGYADSAVYNLHLRYTRTTRTDEQAVWRMPTAAKYEHVTHG